MMIKADLHLHSTASDGRLTPTEIVDWASNKGFKVIALTDHDTVDGVDEAKAEGEKKGVQVVAGIELSTFSTTEIHVLGYALDYKDAAFQQSLQATKDYRKERNIKLGEKLDEYGVKPHLDFSANGLGRMNIARAMLSEGLVRSTDEAFDVYLGANGKAYAPTKRLSPLEAVKMISSANGVAVIAHPKKLYMAHALEPLLQGLKPYGLKGLECYYPGHSVADVGVFTSLAVRYGLVQTGGSDYHGDEERNFELNLDERVARVLGVKL